MALGALKGCKITGLWKDDDSVRMIFEIDDGERMAFVTEGDCCSVSWFNDVIGFSYLLGTVSGVEDIPMTEHPPSDSYNHIDVYGYKITTDLGIC